jgi:hypothetical protein
MRGLIAQSFKSFFLSDTDGHCLSSYAVDISIYMNSVHMWKYCWLSLSGSPGDNSSPT